ncbi:MULTISPECIES: ArsR/SmtB family transcription factor [Brevibacterium]|uniref:HTH arsR-type domain-containing protein n=1 Tax=Brevibacterium salitolerans TaxID=1403566 RepID=A0ABN2WQ35_9MICO|nr:metalloregulator ArsR/SmtB family transcription factor [Brevibacterium sp.]
MSQQPQTVGTAHSPGAQAPVEVCAPDLDPADGPDYSAETLDRTAEVFRALAASSRLRILLVLTRGETSVSGIVDETGLSQPLVSQHLKLLRSLHLVEVRRMGREAIYSFKDDHVSHILLDALDHSVEHEDD